jgi:regulator of replication initiation timing
MNEDYRELVEYLDKKFLRISEEIAQLRGEMSEEITELRGEVGDIKEKMATKIEVNNLLDAVDAYMKQGEDYR